jgi:hypothetical protein
MTLDSYGLLKVISWCALLFWVAVIMSASEFAGLSAAFRWL